MFPQLYGYAITSDELLIGPLADIQPVDKYANGVFVQISENQDKFFIKQNYFCGYGLFIFRRDRFWAVSNSLLLLIKKLVQEYKLGINNDYFDLYIIHELAMPSLKDTIINEIEELIPGEYIEIDKKIGSLCVKKEDYSFYTHDPLSEESIDILDRWQNKYERLANTLLQLNFPLSVDLSGGMDSRMGFAAAKNIDFKSLNVTIHSIKSDIHTFKEDYEIASKIASILNVPLNKPLDLDSITLDDQTAFMLSLYSKFFANPEMHFPHKLFTTAHFYISGTGGEALRAYKNYTLEEYSNKLCRFKILDALDFNQGAKRQYLKVHNNIQKNFGNRFNDAQMIYIYTQQKNHFMRSGVESMLVNSYGLFPLIDLSLFKINIAKDGLYARDILATLIYGRFLPQLNDVMFQGARRLDSDALQWTMELSERFKSKLADQPDFKIVMAKRDYIGIQSHNGPLNKDYAISLYQSPAVGNFLARNFGPSLPEFINTFLYTRDYNRNRYCLQFLSYYILDSLLNTGNFDLSQLLDNSYYPRNDIRRMVEDLATLRLDVMTFSDTASNITITKSNDHHLEIFYPGWKKLGNNQGVVCETRLSPFNADILLHAAGTTSLSIMPINRWDKNKTSLPLKLDILALKILDLSTGKVLYNKKNIFGLSLADPFKYTFVNQGNITIRIQVNFQPYSYLSQEILTIMQSYEQGYIE